MRRGYLWVNWVELGCRGWEIDETGAGLHFEDGQTCHEGCYARVDRPTLHIVCVGCCVFYARILGDLMNADVFKLQRVVQYRMLPTTMNICNEFTGEFAA